MKSRFVKIRGISLRLAVLMAIAFTSLIPVQLSADAQGSSAPIQVVRSLYTSEFGVNDPKGLAFSPTANTFFVIGESGSISLVTMGEDNAGTQTLSEVQDDALNVAFDKKIGQSVRVQAWQFRIGEDQVQWQGYAGCIRLAEPFCIQRLWNKGSTGRCI